MRTCAETVELRYVYDLALTVNECAGRPAERKGLATVKDKAVKGPVIHTET